MSIRTWVVGHTPGQLDIMTARLRAYNLVDRMPTRVCLLRGTTDEVIRTFRGVRSGIIFTSGSAGLWKVPAPDDREEFLYLRMDV